MDRDPRLDPLPGDRLEDGGDLVDVLARVFRRGGAVPLVELAWWRNATRSAQVLRAAELGDAFGVGPNVSFEQARTATEHLWPPRDAPR